MVFINVWSVLVILIGMNQVTGFNSGLGNLLSRVSGRLKRVSKAEKPAILKSPMFPRTKVHRSAIDSTSIDITTSELVPKSDSLLYDRTPLPTNPSLLRGRLSNGFEYIILPHTTPKDKFEAHLAVLSGSIDELNHQQGMAHLTEHVSYMGSTKRAALSGTGSKTNAYTDFHTTVFFASCPTSSSGRPLLPCALDALVDVLQANIKDDRLEKERAAVLSEASMVNNVNYRVESQLLRSLHQENRLPSRFPIGLESQIKSWTTEEVQTFHDIHYRPDNAVLFVVGDVDVQSTIKEITDKFGALSARIPHWADIMRQSNEFNSITVKNASRFFPPLQHKWACPKDKAKDYLSHLPGEIVDAISSGVTMPAADRLPCVVPIIPKVHQHASLEKVSMHLSTKVPVQPLRDTSSLTRMLLKKLVVGALSIRLALGQTSRETFTMADTIEMNWAREGCAVFSLDLMAENEKWKDALTIAITEVRRMGLFGLSDQEFQRQKQSFLSDLTRSADQYQKMTGEEVLAQLMEATYSDSVFIGPQEHLSLVNSLLRKVTLDDANYVARELCQHLSHWLQEEASPPFDSANMNASVESRRHSFSDGGPSSIALFAPTVDRDGKPFVVNEQQVAEVILNALSTRLDRLPEQVMPRSLYGANELQTRLDQLSPSWVAVDDKVKQIKWSKNEAGSESLLASLFSSLPFTAPPVRTAVVSNVNTVHRKLSNGLKINLMSTDTEPHRATIRISIPGGRLLEDSSMVGAVTAGAWILQEGGAFRNFSREDVELFCVDHGVQVMIKCKHDSLQVDLSAFTERREDLEYSGFEAAMQIARVLFNDLELHQDSFQRAKEMMHAQFSTVQCHLEEQCTERLAQHFFKNNTFQFTSPSHDEIERLNFGAVSSLMKDIMKVSKAEISIVADAPVQEIENLCMRYFGSIPGEAIDGETSKGTSPVSVSVSASVSASTPPILQHPAEPISDSEDVASLIESHRIDVFLPEVDERAMGYLAGLAPNSWGQFPDGSSLSSRMNKLDAKRKAKLDVVAHRNHPLFGRVIMNLFQELASRRLFRVVREDRQLTYDAYFKFIGFNSDPQGYFLVAVTSSPSQVEEAVHACKDALASLVSPSGIDDLQMESSKKFLLDSYSSSGLKQLTWARRMMGSQLEEFSCNGVCSLADFDKVLSSITVGDLRCLMEVLQTHSKSDWKQRAGLTTCVGVAASDMPERVE